MMIHSKNYQDVDRNLYLRDYLLLNIPPLNKKLYLGISLKGFVFFCQDTNVVVKSK